MILFQLLWHYIYHQNVTKQIILFPILSLVPGVQVTYDLRAPNGQRVVEAKIRCAQCEVPRFEPLAPETEYDILTNDYLIQGGDGYDMLEEEVLELVWFGKDAICFITTSPYLS